MTTTTYTTEQLDMIAHKLNSIVNETTCRSDGLPLIKDALQALHHLSLRVPNEFQSTELMNFFNHLTEYKHAIENGTPFGSQNSSRKLRERAARRIYMYSMYA